MPNEATQEDIEYVKARVTATLEEAADGGCKLIVAYFDDEIGKRGSTERFITPVASEKARQNVLLSEQTIAIESLARLRRRAIDKGRMEFDEVLRVVLRVNGLPEHDMAVEELRDAAQAYVTAHPGETLDLDAIAKQMKTQLN